MAHSAVKKTPKGKNVKPVISSSSDRMPAHWDSTMNDLTEFKATPAEIARRKASHMSKNQLVAKIELQRRALNSAVKSAKKPLPAVFVREVLPKPENVCSEVTDLSPQTLAICADRILEKSARLTAPSVCSSADLHNVNPTVTKMPETKENGLNQSGGDQESCVKPHNSRMLPVQITPMVRSRLDRLAEAVTAPVALNEPSLLLENEQKKHRSNSSLSNSSKTTSSDKPKITEVAPPSISSVQESEIISNKPEVKPETKHNKSRLPEKAAVLEELFRAMQIDATEAGLLAESGDGDDVSSSSSHSTLSGHTALLVRVLIGLVARIRQLESQVNEMSLKLSSADQAASVTCVNALNDKVSHCERKIDQFQEELRLTSGATTESLQRIRAELESVCINKPPSVAPSNCNNGSTQNVNALVNLPPVLDQELDAMFDEFDSEPWPDNNNVNKKVAHFEFDDQKLLNNNEDNSNIENVENNNSSKQPRSGSISPPPSSIHFPSNESASCSSIMFGDRLGTQLAELTRQHEQARARLQAMQRSVHTMGRYPISSKP